MELRLSGISYRAIATRLGISSSGAERMVKSGLKALPKDQAELVKEMELDRLDTMQAGIWNRVRRGDIHAIDRALRIQERRAKFMGLDSPTRVDLGPLADQVAREMNLNDDQRRRLEEDTRSYLNGTLVLGVAGGTTPAE